MYGETHGMSRSSQYATWASMIARCTRPSHAYYHRYGGRGIKVCKRWLTFVGFWADMGPTWQKGLTLERRNNDGPYCKSNCRWATRKEQASNRSDTRFVETSKGRMPLKAAAKAFGIRYGTLQARLDTMGWDLNRALTTPVLKRRNSAIVSKED